MKELFGLFSDVLSDLEEAKISMNLIVSDIPVMSIGSLGPSSGVYLGTVYDRGWRSPICVQLIVVRTIALYSLLVVLVALRRFSSGPSYFQDGFPLTAMHFKLFENEHPLVQFIYRYFVPLFHGNLSGH